MDRAAPQSHIRAEVDMNAVAKLPKADKPKRISAKVMRAVTFLENGEAKTLSTAATMAGISREYLSRSFADVDVQLKHRQNLIPGLVETVRGFVGHEHAVL